MGVDTNISCKTCKVEYYLGYGGYSTEDARKQRFPARDHIGHDLSRFYSTDYLEEREDGHLWTALADIGWHMYEDSIFIENYSSFKTINFELSPDGYKNNENLLEELDKYYDWITACRVLQGDPSLEDGYKLNPLFGKFIGKS